MTVNFSKDMMIGMLRKGQTGNDILDILNVIVSEDTELTCVENDSDTMTVAL